MKGVLVVLTELLSLGIDLSLQVEPTYIVNFSGCV